MFVFDKNLSFNILCETRSPQIMSLLSADISNDNNEQWYAMRATYHREMLVRDALDLAGIECYLPTTQKLKNLHGRKIRVTTPLVSSLIFVKSSKERLQRFKVKVPYLQYMTRPVGDKNVPIVVPKKQMDDFIMVTKADSERLMFFKPGELDVKHGSLVRLHGGAFDGIEGVIVKVTGKRNKHFVLEVNGVISVALECTDVQFVEVL